MANTYPVLGGQATGDLNTATVNILPAVTGRIYSIKSVFISNATAAQNYVIEESGGTNILGPFYLAINGNTGHMHFDPGAFKLAEGMGVNVLGSGTAVATAVVEAYIVS